MRLGYNTNGLQNHRLEDALELLAGHGYRAVALTLDVQHLDPYRCTAADVARIAQRLRALDLLPVIETGARFLLDPLRKHHPNLLDPDRAARARRIELLQRHVDLAADLDASVVSLWAGVAPGGVVGDRDGESGAHEELWARLCAGLAPVLARARDQGVQLAFEPEPGMFLSRPRGYVELVERLGDAGDALGLCLDVGHCHATGDLPVTGVIRALAPRLLLVQLDDCKNGEHVHRMFGEGDLDLAAALAALFEVGFDGVAAVELSRDSHRGPEAARTALEHLRAALARR